MAPLWIAAAGHMMAPVVDYVVKAVNAYNRGQLDEEMPSFASPEAVHEPTDADFTAEDFTPPEDLPEDTVAMLSVAVGAVASHYLPSPSFDAVR